MAEWTGRPAAALVGVLTDVLTSAVDLVLPRPCPGCGRGEPWCAGCAAALDRRPRRVQASDEALDAAPGLPLPPIRALARYTGPVRAAILAGKEGGRTDLPLRLGRSVGAALSRLPGWGVSGAQIWIVPAPSRRVSARRRGGDPVTAMARAAARSLAGSGIPVGVAPCLVTSGKARDSVGLGASARVANLAGRVRFRRSAAPPAGARVVLLDDVVTTGATFVAAVRVLAEHGIEVTEALAVATAAPWLTVRR